jgi:subtilisin family serine protease
MSAASDPRPAWSDAFAADSLSPIRTYPPLGPRTISREWAWGGSTGKGVKVAIIDIGVASDHPAVGGVNGYVAVREEKGKVVYDLTPHTDDYGHGTACAGIIRSLAPECEIYSIKVLGANLTGRGVVFAAGLRWAVENGMHVCNMSLSTGRSEFYGLFHELADLAYFRRIPLVCAANNVPGPSYPSLYGVVLSVAAHEGADPEQFDANPQPPVELGAPGLNVRVRWLQGGYISATSNSFATPHIAGLVTRILGKHPGLTVFQIKTILYALASNAATVERESTEPIVCVD